MTTITRTWYLEVNEIPLALPCWEIPNLDVLLGSPSLRGLGGLVMHGAAGRRPYPPIVDATTVGPIPLDINGAVDDDGDPTSNALESMAGYRDYLQTALGFNKQTDSGLVEVILHRGGLPSKTGEAIFTGLQGWTTIASKAGAARTTFDLWLPDGELLEGGS